MAMSLFQSHRPRRESAPPPAASTDRTPLTVAPPAERGKLLESRPSVARRQANLTTNPPPPSPELRLRATLSSEPPPEAPLAHRPRDCAATARSGGQQSAQSHAEPRAGGAAGDDEHGEHGEDATLPGASTVASCRSRWADRCGVTNPRRPVGWARRVVPKVSLPRKADAPGRAAAAGLSSAMKSPMDARSFLARSDQRISCGADRSRVPRVIRLRSRRSDDAFPRRLVRGKRCGQLRRRPYLPPPPS